MLQVGRHTLDAGGSPLLRKCYLIIDCDTKYCEAFKNMRAREGIAVIRLPPSSPKLNAYTERFVRSANQECVSKAIPIGQGMLRRVLREYLKHYHWQRNQQRVGNVLLMPPTPETSHQGAVTRQQRLGGLLNDYDRAAA